MSSEPAPVHEPARSKRGARVGSCLRHHSSIAPESVVIAEASCAKRSAPSLGTAYTTWIWLPPTTSGRSFALGAPPHQVTGVTAPAAGAMAKSTAATTAAASGAAARAFELWRLVARPASGPHWTRPRPHARGVWTIRRSPFPTTVSTPLSLHGVTSYAFGTRSAIPARTRARGPKDSGSGPDAERRGQPGAAYLSLFGCGGRGVLFGLQAMPGLNTCGSWRPSLLSCPNDCD